MSGSPSFPFLRLPFLAIQNIVHNLSCTEITELSLCSRGSKRLMQSIRHPEPTNMEITIYRRLMYVSLVKRSFVCSLWAIEAKNGRCQHLYRDNVIGGVAVRVLKLGQTRSRIDAPQQPEIAMKALVDHLKDVFKLPLTVMFEPFGLENYRRFLPIFPVCYRLYVYSCDKISEEELQFIRDNVVARWRSECHSSNTSRSPRLRKRTARTELSMCSRKSKILMQSIRHSELTDIEITIDRLRMYVHLKNRLDVCLGWSIETELEVEKFRHLYRDDVMGGVNVKVIKFNDSNFLIYAPQQPENFIKVLVDHLKDVFKLPLTVYFKLTEIENYRRFLPIFPVCYRFFFYGIDKISGEELQFIKDNVVVEWWAEYYTSEK